ncbi:aspartate/glutamate racemase family protein [Yonghaparkia sp. Root332]|uniref:aspartate/glutamate racemase family protein n=1 Tax=Yonghaparkia sp. Root332 TaxID=1736516 RepID=UPI0006F54E03|nr:aspartate/glutamate racemase family protein [Yonghaparkia sp. Root332]KQV25996.1 racemase [Yonghaparkia sp. Root332]
MKTIGLIGGMSWESSALSYRLINEEVRDRLGGFHSARAVMTSVDFAEIEALQAADDWDAAGAVLAREAQALERAGAELIMLCTNTMHLVADRIESAVDVPFLHIADVTADAIQAGGQRAVGLLGTRFTMEKAFYRERLEARGITVIVPEEGDRSVVHDIIYGELVHGVVRQESRQAYREVVERLVERGAEGVVLGCTEIELLVGADDVDVAVHPTTRIQARAAVAAALAD